MGQLQALVQSSLHFRGAGLRELISNLLPRQFAGQFMHLEGQREPLLTGHGGVLPNLGIKGGFWCHVQGFGLCFAPKQYTLPSSLPTITLPSTTAGELPTGWPIS